MTWSYREADRGTEIQEYTTVWFSEVSRETGC